MHDNVIITKKRAKRVHDNVIITKKRAKRVHDKIKDMDKKEKIIRMVQHTATDLHVRESKEEGKESRRIRGYAIIFDQRSVLMGSWDGEDIYEVIDRNAVTQQLLDASDIKMTMFHDRQLILARANNGKGTLEYGIDDKGVWFEFEAPVTVDGDKALALVKRGDISGCSFAFSTHYYDEKFVVPDIQKTEDRTVITYHVKEITGIYDFTLAADPAYPDTSCETDLREVTKMVAGKEDDKDEEEKHRAIEKQIAEMREAAKETI